MPAPEARADFGKQQLNIANGAIIHPTVVDNPGQVENDMQDSLGGSNNALVQGTKIKHESLYTFDDHLDTVVLGERRRMLVSRKLMQSSGSYMGDQGNIRLCNFSKVVLEDVGVQIETQKGDPSQDMLSHKNVILRVNGDDDVSRNITDGTGFAIKKFSHSLPNYLCNTVPLLSKASPTSVEPKYFGGQEITMTDADAVSGSVASVVARVKNEPADISELYVEERNDIENFFAGDAARRSVSSLVTRVKNEPVDISEFCGEVKNVIQNFTMEIRPVKSELSSVEYLEDELDHLPLIDRINLLSSEVPSFNKSRSVGFNKEESDSGLDVGADVLESVKPINILRPRKRKKTATNSVETALEEDAPELLKVLMERGVALEEIKLYGEEESEDTLDDSLSEDGFAELEAVISQLFSQRQSFLKFPLLRFTKDAKASYCLSCLLSLVEQTRYLRHRKWPVEWGWCRDLQSFIFVFERHNRIVLERPEYGFATYFFELLNFIPVEWQIKRLVTAMKLTSCGRITLIENKPLVVGEDLSEGEAQVLAEYGWTPNTGLGTMLNYCDRVVHDRKQEMDSVEWRSKIARQLMNGYNGGNMVFKNLPKKLADYQGSQSVQVKLEK